MAAATPIPLDPRNGCLLVYTAVLEFSWLSKTVDLQVPADSEFVLEGTITPGEVMSDGPFGDHKATVGGRFAVSV